MYVYSDMVKGCRGMIIKKKKREREREKKKREDREKKSGI
jgi:hypothetical protein